MTGVIGCISGLRTLLERFTVCIAISFGAACYMLWFRLFVVDRCFIYLRPDFYYDRTLCPLRIFSDSLVRGYVGLSSSTYLTKIFMRIGSLDEGHIL